MSEQLGNHNEQERKPAKMFFDCGRCEEKFELTPENTIGMLHEKQRDCDFVICACPNCDYRTKVFVDDATMENCYLAGFNIQTGVFADDRTYNEWIESNEIKLPETYELTNRHEELIGKFATTLANTPDEHLYDLITDTGYDKPYPQRWT